jgi:hypothetical protein
MRIPEAGPFGETFLDASALAITLALFLNRPGSGCVESVVTVATHRFLFLFVLVFLVLAMDTRSSSPKVAPIATMSAGWNCEPGAPWERCPARLSGDPAGLAGFEWRSS